MHIENLDRRQVEQERDTPAHRLSCEDPAVRMEEQQINNAHHQQVRGNRLASLRALKYEAENFYNATNVDTLTGVFKLWYY